MICSNISAFSEEYRPPSHWHRLFVLRCTQLIAALHCVREVRVKGNGCSFESRTKFHHAIPGYRFFELARCLAGGRPRACRRCKRGVDGRSGVRAVSTGNLRPSFFPTPFGDSCLRLSVYWCQAALNCPYVVAGAKCASRASTRSSKEATRKSEFINARRATMKCGLPFGPPTSRTKLQAPIGVVALWHH